MFGLIGKLKARTGQRDALISILLQGTGGMPGCINYIVATDPHDPEGVWVTEVWDSEQSHQASLQLPAVQSAIAQGKPLIAGFEQHTRTLPIGGHGLTAA